MFLNNFQISKFKYDLFILTQITTQVRSKLNFQQCDNQDTEQFARFATKYHEQMIPVHLSSPAVVR